MLETENRKRYQEILRRSKEWYYTYAPYFNVTDGEPSWQWKILSTANDYKGRLVLGANRIGKTEQGAYEMVLAVSGRHPTRKFPQNGLGWIVGLDNAMIRDVDLPMFNKFLPETVKLSSTFNKQDNIWTINWGDRHWKVAFKSTEMDPNKFQGAQVDAVWIDEEPKRTEIFSEIETRLVDNAGIWWMTATPIRGTAWLKELSLRDDVFTTFGSMWDNPFLPQVEIKKLWDKLSEDEREVRISGKYVVFGGRPVFNRKTVRELAEKLEKELESGPKIGILVAA